MTEYIQLNIATIKEQTLGQIKVTRDERISSIKQKVAKLQTAPGGERQSLRLSPRDKTLDDDTTVSDLRLTNNSVVYVKDLGPQISWRTVFICEYLGPLVLYLLVATRPRVLYGVVQQPASSTAVIALLCWTLHYTKRLYETVMVHRFSHGTMPLRNLFKNCMYYWGFALYVTYNINHPLYTPPALWQTFIGAAIFFVCELGNLSVHLLLRDLRPEGTRVRKIPVPNGNILTSLFDFVSCPNYTYEVGAWLGFSFMTSSVPALIFTLAGAVQMLIWARSKHKSYKREFGNYPKGRKAMIPFVL